MEPLSYNFILTEKSSTWVLLKFWGYIWLWDPRYCPWVVKYSIYERNLSSNFCSFTFKSMKWDSKRWLDSFYILARPFSLPYPSVRATAHHNTRHFKEIFVKIQNLPISSAESSSWWNVKELCMDAAFFLLIRLSNWFLPKNFRHEIKCRISYYW